MDNEKIVIMAEIKDLCNKTRMMRADIAKSLGVNEKTLVRWQSGKTIINLRYYKRLQNLVNKILAERCA